MTTTAPLRMHRPGRLGTALLLTAAAASRCGVAQTASKAMALDPARMLASLSKSAVSVRAVGSVSGGAAPVTFASPTAHLATGYTTKPSAARKAPPARKLQDGDARALAYSLRHPGDVRGLAVVSPPTRLERSTASLYEQARPERVVASITPPVVVGHTLVSAPAAAAASHAVNVPLDPAAGSFNLSGTAGSEHTLHLTVGHLMFLNTKARVRRIFIANPAVLDSYTVSPNQVVLTAKASGLSSVVVWDQNDESQVYMVSSDINVDELRSSVKQAMPNEDVQVEGREGKVVLTGTVGTDALSDAAGKLAALFSKDVANSLVVNSAKVRQVRLKVRIVEVDRSKLQQFGINIFNPGGGSTVGGGTTSQFPVTSTLTPGNGSTPPTLTVSDPLNFLFYSFKYNIGVTIKDLENKQVLQILAEPTITTLSGQKASFLAGGEFPFPVVQGSAGGTATVTVQFRPYGVKLEFTPQVNIDGSIALKVAPEVSALDFANSVTISGYTIPALSTKRADTQVVLQSGQSFAISGLLDRRTTDAFSHTPGIASVPILGQLFKSKNINLSTTELVVIVTPTIVDPLSEVLEPAEATTEPQSRKDNPNPGLIRQVSPTQGEPGPIVPFMKPELFDTSLPSSDKNKKK